jgi:hypothetical protein
MAKAEQKAPAAKTPPAKTQGRRADKGAPAAAPSTAAQPRSTGKVPPRLKERYFKTVVPGLMKERGYANPLEVPRLHKIVINMGVGEGRDNAKVLDFAAADLLAVTGQLICRMSSPGSGAMSSP